LWGTERSELKSAAQQEQDFMVFFMAVLRTLQEGASREAELSYYMRESRPKWERSNQEEKERGAMREGLTVKLGTEPWDR